MSSVYIAKDEAGLASLSGPKGPAAVAIAAAHRVSLGSLDANRLASSFAPHQLDARLF